MIKQRELDVALHPQSVTESRDGQLCLYVFAATPSTIPLVPRIVAFLREARARVNRQGFLRPRRRRRPVRG
jgi:hypothetical protein